MSVEFVEVVDNAWFGMMAPRSYQFKVRTRIVNDFAASGLSVMMFQTIVRTTVYKVVGSTQTPLSNANNVTLTYKNAQNYHEIQINSGQPGVLPGTLLRVEINIAWVLQYNELNAGSINHQVPAFPTLVTYEAEHVVAELGEEGEARGE